MINNTKNVIPKSIKEKNYLGTLSNTEKVIKCEDDAIEMFCSIHSNHTEPNIATKENCIKIIGAKFNMNYINTANLMMLKHVSKNRNVVNGIDDVIIINSFDGAEAFWTKKNCWWCHIILILINDT